MSPTEHPDRLASLSPMRRALLQQRLRGGGVSSPPHEDVHVTPRTEGATVPLTFAQARLFRRILSEDRSSRNHFSLLELRGTLDSSALLRAAREVVSRHENLNTTFEFGDGEPAPRVSNPPADIELVDLSAVDAFDRLSMAKQYAMEEGRRAYDLERGPLVRVRLFRLDESHHVLLLAVHLIVFDVWSVGVTTRELSLIYDAIVKDVPSSLPPLRFQYGDFAIWQRRTFTRSRLQPQLDYWRKQLTDGVPRLALDGRKAALNDDCAFREAFLDIRLPASIVAAAAEFGRVNHATLFMTLLAAFDTLLFCLTQEPRIVTGTPIANRNYLGTDALIGYFPNVLPTIVNFYGDPSFTEVLERVRVATVGAFAHQDLPLDRYLTELMPGPPPSVLSPILFSVQNTPIPPLRLGDLEMEPLALDYGVMAPFDMTVLLIASDVLIAGKGAVAGMLHYNANLYSADTIASFWSRYVRLLEHLLRLPTRPVGTFAVPE